MTTSALNSLVYGTVRRLIAVTSCKGGVGKSTVSVELAFRLASRGFKVGLFDADVHGPSLPTQLPMDLGAKPVELVNGGWAVKPLLYSGVKLMSFGWISRLWTKSDGEVRTGQSPGDLTSMLLHSTAWGALDYLIIDSPPGTGEIPLSLYTNAPLHGAVVVTTPSPLATADVVRGIRMLSRFNVPVLAIVENMASFKCGSCSETHFPFGRGHINEVLATLGSGASEETDVFSLPIVPASKKSTSSITPVDGLRPSSGLELHFDLLVDALEKKTANSVPIELHKHLQFHERAHWPTVISMAGQASMDKGPTSTAIPYF